MSILESVFGDKLGTALAIQSQHLLFNVKDDPKENRNLFDSANHRAVVDQLKALLARGWNGVLPATAVGGRKQ
jgi:hypothetical protein